MYTLIHRGSPQNPKNLEIPRVGNKFHWSRHKIKIPVKKTKIKNLIDDVKQYVVTEGFLDLILGQYEHLGDRD